MGIGDIDPGRFAVGYTVSVEVGGSAIVGVRGGGELSVAQFTDSKYGGYNYVYAGARESAAVGAQADLSANIGGNVFVAYNTDTQPVNPQSFGGTFYSATISADLKAIAGGGINIGAFSGTLNGAPGWKGISLGITAGVGVGINAGTATGTLSYTYLVNDVKPTSERSFLDRASNLVAPVPSALTTGLIVKLRR